MWKKLAKVLIVLLCLAVIFSSYGYLAFWYYFQYKTYDLPDVMTLKNYDFNLSTMVYDDEGNPINRFAVEDRVYVPFRDIPQTVINAVGAAEDKKFFSKRLILGIDQIGIARAAWKNFLAGKTVAGGSTITQQVAKLIWLNNERSFSRKFKEARLAYRMEKYLPKELIFEIYINLVYFGHGKYGIITASEFYFGKKPSELANDEAAMLAGLIKWPYQFSPIERPKAAQNRRNAVLERMRNNGFISADGLKELKAKPLGLNVKNAEIKAPYFPVMEELHQFGYEKVVNQGLDVRLSLNSNFQQIAETALQKGFAAYEERHKKRLVLYNIFSDYEMESLDDFKSSGWSDELGVGSISDGLITEVDSLFVIAKVGSDAAFITANSFKNIRQDIADLTKVFKIGDVVSLRINGVDEYNNFSVEIIQPEVQGAVVVLDIETGGIKAVVGGRDFQISQYNRAMQAERQAGSAFKPFVYSAFFEKYPEKDLQSTVLDSPICFKTGNLKKPKWCPKNYEEKSLPRFMGPIPIKTAIARSRNVAAVRTAYGLGSKKVVDGKEVYVPGINNVVDLAESLGITSELPRYLPTAIGAADVKVIDMACAFTAFFRNGIYKPCWFLESVEDKKQGLRNFAPVEEKQALSAEAANKVLEGMRWVVLAGTARSAAKELSFAVAGKTGTTNGFTDAWFIGGPPRYIVAVWVGFDRKAIPLVSREVAYKETGGFTALPIAIEILKGIYKDRPYDMFPEEMENRIKGIKKPVPQPSENNNPIAPAKEPDIEKTNTPE